MSEDVATRWQDTDTAAAARLPRRSFNLLYKLTYLAAPWLAHEVWWKRMRGGWRLAAGERVCRGRACKLQHASSKPCLCT